MSIHVYSLSISLRYNREPHKLWLANTIQPTPYRVQPARALWGTAGRRAPPSGPGTPPAAGPAPGPWASPRVLAWTNYNSTGGGWSFFGLPACLPFFLPSFAKYPQIFLKENLEKFNSGNTLTSGNYLGFPSIPGKFRNNVSEKYAIWYFEIQI